MKKRMATATRGGQKRFNRGSRYTIVSPSGYGTPIKILDVVSLDGNGKRGLLVVIDRRSTR
jgi:hypothetical protein